MRAIQIEAPGGQLVLSQLPVPRPGPGEVLIRMAAAPINPSDLNFIRSSHADLQGSPVVPGREGSGTVVAAGNGLLPRLWLGRRVACAASSSSGTWAEYMVTRATLSVPLGQNLSLEQGSMLLVNPLTALAFFDMVKRGRHPALVNTAAASALGRMILRLGIMEHVPVIHIVRRQEQADFLNSLGAQYVLISGTTDFVDRLRELAGKLNATLILDAVGGQLATQLLDAAPRGSTVLMYANLSGERLSFDPHLLWNDEKQVAGFYLANWVAKRHFIQLLFDFRKVQRLATSELQTNVQKRLPLSAARQAIDVYLKDMTAGKILLILDPEQIPVDRI